MLILRIKQAEVALADGRLDEAFDLASAPDIRSHRRGQELAGRLARALVARGQGHLQAGRVPQASADCEKAVRLAGNLSEAADLRTAIAATLVDQRHQQEHQAHLVAAAQHQIQNGFLSVGARLLEKAGPANGAATVVADDLAARRALMDAVLVKAADALDRDDWEAAIDELGRLAPNHVDARLRQLMVRASQQVGARIAAAIQAGRLDLACALCTRLARLPQKTLEIEELQRNLDQCRSAWRCLSDARLREAEEILLRLATIVPEADWIDPALTQIRHAASALEQLRAGPLGLLAELPPDQNTLAMPNPAPSPPDARPAPYPAPQAKGAGFPARFVLQVDGVGSFLVLLSPKGSFGPISGSAAVDVVLLADPHTPRIAIERDQDDYFLRSKLPVEINGRPAISRLLASGDQIALSSRCRLAFRIPAAASTSAVLDLVSARLPRGDVRRIILMDRELIIGPGASSHVRADQLPQPIVLYLRNGNLYCQTRLPLAIDGQAAHGPAAVAIGSHVTAGDLTMTAVQA